MAAAMSLQFTPPSSHTQTELQRERHYSSIVKPVTLRHSDYMPRDMTVAFPTDSNPPQVLKRKREPINGNFTMRDEVAILCEEGRLKEAVDMLYTMDERGGQVNRNTYTLLLKTSIRTNNLMEGKRIHTHIIKTSGFKVEIILSNHFIHMYAKCSCLGYARQVFDKLCERNLVSWNTIIAGYARDGQGAQAMNLFRQMHQAGVKPDRFTFGSVLRACACLATLKQVEDIHAHVIKNGLELDIFVGSALVDVYAKCFCIEDAQKLFDELPERDLVSWTALIAAYAESGQSTKAIKIFCEMQRTGIKPNAFSFTSALVSCSALAVLDQGKQFHGLIIKHGLLSDVPVGNSLITMYCKCGNIEDAEKVFDRMCARSVISWSAMIAGYAYHGSGKEALQLFEHMQNVGVEPNHITFIGVLSACSHVGLVDEGRRYFDLMRRDYGIVPIAEHYACFVDILGRAGLLDEAEGFIDKMPLAPSDSVWRTLLGACRVHNNIEMGLLAAERLLELTPQDASAYVLLSNIYAAAGRLDDVAKVRKMMDDMGVEKEAGLSWIEIRSKVHTFAVRDRSHPQTEYIYAALQELSSQMKKSGYKPNTKFVLHDVEEEQKEQYMCHHSEKLAIAFGVISLSPGTPIRIVKNLRVCHDCHSATKFISKTVGREIVVRDSSRFHHFKNGLCSCGDYW